MCILLSVENVSVDDQLLYNRSLCNKSYGFHRCLMAFWIWSKFWSSPGAISHLMQDFFFFLISFAGKTKQNKPKQTKRMASAWNKELGVS